MTVNMLFEGKGSWTGLVKVPLDRALLSFYRLSIVTILLCKCKANFDCGSDPHISLLVGGLGPLSNAMLDGTT